MIRWAIINRIVAERGYRRGAELGVADGVFTTYLLEKNPSLHMVAVDLWGLSEVRHEQTHVYDEWDHAGLYSRYLERVEPFKGRVTTLRMRTDEAAAHVDDDSLDFVFIDADHSYETCRADIDKWSPKVRKGGLISGHDINLASVRRAVEETGPYEWSDNKVWLRWN